MRRMTISPDLEFEIGIALRGICMQATEALEEVTPARQASDVNIMFKQAAILGICKRLELALEQNLERTDAEGDS